MMREFNEEHFGRRHEKAASVRDTSLSSGNLATNLTGSNYHKGLQQDGWGILKISLRFNYLNQHEN